MSNIVGSIRLAEMVNSFWDNRAKKQLAEQIVEIEGILASDDYFGWLVKNDKMGYLRALSKAKYVFRGLNRDDVYDGMIDNEGINPEFVAMVEEFYYNEIRRNANIVDLKLARYNALRDALIERTENDKTAYVDYAQIEFNITRAEMFEKVKKNEFVFVKAVANDTWYILKKDRYKKGIETNTAFLNYPLELCS
ncbi:hypothetical protein BBW65_05770 [Helicobacter enhydrae]|uniref:Uncharacterized protein n=1 Tax=Helicobacter enhydrae TaxID=222136 RepID=A0A1B1U555_9HELI|nr:hypothetical protein [Helicobacter enhydrae]ANV97889.1 hypothetical protein BBW65_03330 [Helicobacter enhydrae]ANV98337.1 hypothetical protein BBW65_05770 [Helicobacter enhydrae]